MSDQPTLNSRIRVLIAKAFKAEKLYCSIRNLQALQTSHDIPCVSELANCVRSREWQNSHFKLRTALNEILDLSNSQEMAAHLVALRNLFSQQVDKAFASMKKTENDLTEATKREDYAYTLKQSLDLVKLKARGQAAKVITDELTALLSSSGKSNIEPAQNAGFGAFRLVAGGDAVSDEPQFTSEAKVNRQVAPRDSKVIPFRRNRLS